MADVYRTRIRDNVFKTSYGKVFYTHPIYGSNSYGPFEVDLIPFYERIHDIQNGPLRKRKPVSHLYHVKLAGSGVGYGGFYADTPGGWRGKMNIPIHLDPHTVDVSIVPKLYEKHPDYSDLGYSAFTSFTTQVPMRLDLVNTVREAPDLLDYFKHLASNARGIAATLKRQQNKSTLLGQFRDSYLGYAFGIKPLLSDLKELAELEKNTTERLDFLRRTRNKPTKLNFSRKGEEYNTFYTGNPGLAGNLATVNHLSAYTWKFHAQCVLTHNLKGLDSYGAFLRTLLASTGINNPAAIAWEAVPFSFVIDWVLKVGDQLDKLAIQPFEGKWDISNVQHSIKESAQIDVMQRWHPELGNPWVTSGTWTFSRYVRFMGLPIVPGPHLHGLSDHQQVLLGLLIDQRLSGR